MEPQISFCKALFVGLLLLVVDCVVSTISYGYHIEWDWRRDFADKIFDYNSAELDLWALCIIRLAVVVGALVGVVFNRRNGPFCIGDFSLVFICIGVAMASYSPVKLLALAEIRKDFSDIPWFWTLFSWNIFASALMNFYFVFILSQVKMPKVVEVADDETILVKNEELEVENGRIPGSNHENFPNKGSQKKEKEEEPQIDRRQRISLMWRLLKYCKYEWIWYLSVLGFLLLYAAARVCIPYYTGQVISDIVVHHSYSRLLRSVLMMSLLSLASSICAGLRGGCATYAIAKINIRIRNELFSSLVKQEIGFFDTVKTGEITSRLTADTQTLSDAVASNLNIFLRSFIMGIGTLVFMFHLSWRLALMNFIAMPLIAIVSKWYGKYYEKLSKDVQDTLAKANEVADEIIGSMRTVRSFANESGEALRYSLRLQETMRVRTKQSIAYCRNLKINKKY